MKSSATGRSRLKRVLQNLALSGSVFLLCIAASELVLRLKGYGNLEIYEPDPALYWKLKPNQDCFTKVDHKPVHINSLGTRGPEFPVDKPANTFRILSLGDSRTFGWGLTESETYSARLQKLLQESIGKRREVQVINAGVNAWSYQQMSVYFREYGLRYNPDAVILAEANLWTQFSEQNSPEFVKKFMLRVRLKNLLRRSALYHYVIEIKLQDFYQRHRAKFIPVDPKQDALFKEQQEKDPEAAFRSAIESLCSLALSNRVTPILLYLPTLSDLSATNEPAILRIKRDLSRKLNIPFLDVTSMVRPQAKDLYLEADPVHFNTSGNDIVARQLAETMGPLATQ
jgi:lysophospholipase L1-like esterase